MAATRGNGNVYDKLFTETHLGATERHLPYGITQCYLAGTRYT